MADGTDKPIEKIQVGKVLLGVGNQPHVLMSLDIEQSMVNIYMILMIFHRSSLQNISFLLCMGELIDFLTFHYSKYIDI
jgi:hypothetical protein